MSIEPRADQAPGAPSELFPVLERSIALGGSDRDGEPSLGLADRIVGRGVAAGLGRLRPVGGLSGLEPRHQPLQLARLATYLAPENSAAAIRCGRQPRTTGIRPVADDPERESEGDMLAAIAQKT